MIIKKQQRTKILLLVQLKRKYSGIPTLMVLMIQMMLLPRTNLWLRRAFTCTMKSLQFWGPHQKSMPIYDDNKITYNIQFVWWTTKLSWFLSFFCLLQRILRTKFAYYWWLIKSVNSKIHKYTPQKHQSNIQLLTHITIEP